MQHINEWKAHQNKNLETLSKINNSRWEFINHFTATQPLVRSVRGQGGTSLSNFFAFVRICPSSYYSGS